MKLEWIYPDKALSVCQLMTQLAAEYDNNVVALEDLGGFEYCRAVLRKGTVYQESANLMLSGNVRCYRIHRKRGSRRIRIKVYGGRFLENTPDSFRRNLLAICKYDKDEETKADSMR